MTTVDSRKLIRDQAPSHRWSQDRLIAEGDALTPDNPYRVRTLDSSHLGWLIDPAEAAQAIADIVAEVRAG